MHVGQDGRSQLPPGEEPVGGAAEKLGGRGEEELDEKERKAADAAKAPMQDLGSSREKVRLGVWGRIKQAMSLLKPGDSVATTRLERLGSRVSALSAGAQVMRLEEDVTMGISGAKGAKTPQKLKSKGEAVVSDLEERRDQTKSELARIGKEYWSDLTPDQQKRLALMKPEEFFNHLEPKQQKELVAAFPKNIAIQELAGKPEGERDEITEAPKKRFLFDYKRENFQRRFTELQKRLALVENVNIPDARRQLRIAAAAVEFMESSVKRPPSNEELQQLLESRFGSAIPDCAGLAGKAEGYLKKAQWAAEAGNTAHATRMLIEARNAYHTLSGALGVLKDRATLSEDHQKEIGSAASEQLSEKRQKLIEYARAALLKPLGVRLRHYGATDEDMRAELSFTGDVLMSRRILASVNRPMRLTYAEEGVRKEFERATTPEAIDELFAKHGALEIVKLEERLLMHALAHPNAKVVEERLATLAMVKERVEMLPPQARDEIEQLRKDRGHNDIYNQYKTPAEAAYAVSEWIRLRKESPSPIQMLGKRYADLRRLNTRLFIAESGHVSFQERYSPDQYLLARRLNRRMEGVLNSKAGELFRNPSSKPYQLLHGELPDNNFSQGFLTSHADALKTLADRGLIGDDPVAQTRLLEGLIQVQIPNVRVQSDRSAGREALKDDRYRAKTNSKELRNDPELVVIFEKVARNPKIWVDRAATKAPDMSSDELEKFGQNYADSFQVLAKQAIREGNFKEAGRLSEAYKALTAKVEDSGNPLMGKGLTATMGRLDAMLEVQQFLENEVAIKGKLGELEEARELGEIGEKHFEEALDNVKTYQKMAARELASKLKGLIDEAPWLKSRVIRSPALARAFDETNGFKARGKDKDENEADYLNRIYISLVESRYVPLSVSVEDLSKTLKTVPVSTERFALMRLVEQQRPGAWNQLTGKWELDRLGKLMEDLRTPEKRTRAREALVAYSKHYAESYQPFIRDYDEGFKATAIARAKYDADPELAEEVSTRRTEAMELAERISSRIEVGQQRIIAGYTELLCTPLKGTASDEAYTLAKNGDVRKLQAMMKEDSAPILALREALMAKVYVYAQTCPNVQFPVPEIVRDLRILADLEVIMDGSEAGKKLEDSEIYEAFNSSPGLRALPMQFKQLQSMLFQKIDPKNIEKMMGVLAGWIKIKQHENSGDLPFLSAAYYEMELMIDARLSEAEALRDVEHFATVVQKRPGGAQGAEGVLQSAREWLKPKLTRPQPKVQQPESEVKIGASQPKGKIDEFAEDLQLISGKILAVPGSVVRSLIQAMKVATENPTLLSQLNDACARKGSPVAGDILSYLAIHGGARAEQILPVLEAYQKVPGALQGPADAMKQVVGALEKAVITLEADRRKRAEEAEGKEKLEGSDGPKAKIERGSRVDPSTLSATYKGNSSYSGPLDKSQLEVFEKLYYGDRLSGIDKESLPGMAETLKEQIKIGKNILNKEQLTYLMQDLTFIGAHLVANGIQTQKQINEANAKLLEGSPETVRELMRLVEYRQEACRVLRPVSEKLMAQDLQGVTIKEDLGTEIRGFFFGKPSFPSITHIKNLSFTPSRDEPITHADIRRLSYFVIKLAREKNRSEDLNKLLKEARDTLRHAVVLTPKEESILAGGPMKGLLGMTRFTDSELETLGMKVAISRELSPKGEGEKNAARLRVVLENNPSLQFPSATDLRDRGVGRKSASRQAKLYEGITTSESGQQEREVLEDLAKSGAVPAAAAQQPYLASPLSETSRVALEKTREAIEESDKKKLCENISVLAKDEITWKELTESFSQTAQEFREKADTIMEVPKVIVSAEGARKLRDILKTGYVPMTYGNMNKLRRAAKTAKLMLTKAPKDLGEDNDTAALDKLINFGGDV